MPPTPPSTTSSSNGQSPDAQYRVVRKRNRVPLSCGPCRHRKLKCNRGHPCDNCTKRGDVDSCTYASPSTRKKSQTGHGPAATSDDMQNRIDRLEGLVLSLMTNGAQSAGPAAAAAAIAGSMNSSSTDAGYDVENPETIAEEMEDQDDSEVDHVTKSVGMMKVQNDKHMFISEAHWYSILSEITEVKNYFADHKKQFDDQYRKVKALAGDDESPGSAFIFKHHKAMSREEVLSMFPPKQSVDMLVGRYFNTYDPAYHIIHGPTFQKQYDRHWITPNETSVTWLGLVFAMITLALQSYHRAGDEPPEYKGRSNEMSADYRRLTQQCIVLSDVTQPGMHLLETLVLWLHGEYSRSRDAESGILLSTALITRLAMRMGYHRDPRPYPNITPFQGEMRRRLWVVVRFCDLLFSAQAGLPPTVRESDTNAELPRNIYDDELYEDMKVLPPSRPTIEITPATYMIAKARVVYMFGKISEEVQSLKCSNYDDIMKLDQELGEVQATIPLNLQMRTIEESARDSSSLIMQRYHIELLLRKSQCVLHRKFLGPVRDNTRYAYSRRTAVDAAMTMLHHQATLHRESMPGGRLRSVKWFGSSLTTQEFLLAGMIVCLDLYNTAEAERAGRRASTDTYDWNQEGRGKMISAIETSTRIWESLRDQSMEAFKAYGTLTAMLNKLKEHDAMRQQQQKYAAAAAAFPATVNNGAGMAEDGTVAPEHSAAMTLGMLSTGALTPNTNLPPFDGKYPNYSDSQSAHTGLTPGYTGSALDPTSGAPLNAPSPFSSLFGSGMGFGTGMDMGANGNLDWVSCIAPHLQDLP
ncbi:hypothetical protein K402DRAFT_78111 [Aulographum hederae CBS 113979]|uniref:Zn(2)-C6 fungal-type domain-containing protein n=1 Tax=Aulographum hederae CBS 113979 TaxID=1176131 RepID=A0A6G1HGJ5_9PEZI|nr:hypothetical protein K402DRAFT_78111 [Aulographum hederae CBS 113979]